MNMLRIATICFLLLLPTTLFAAEVNTPGRLGAGIILGAPTGLTAKYWVSRTEAVDAAIGFNDLSVHADYLWHNWDMFPRPKQGRLAAYGGIGAEIGEHHYRDHDYADLGFRAVAGAAYYVARQPIECFLEIAPEIVITRGPDMYLEADLGARYYF